MKFSLALASFVATSFAIAVPKDAPWYTLQTKSKLNTLNNLFLSVNPKNAKLGANPGSTSAAGAAKFFTTPYQKTLSIHSKDDINKLSLVNYGNGLLEVVDMVSPWTKIQSGKGEWDTFVIGSDGQLVVNDGATIPSRKWVAFSDTDGSQYVALWDGYSKLNRNVQEIQIVASKTSAPR